eukprot:350363-Chlamydomonas_euryale.AAC.2
MGTFICSCDLRGPLQVHLSLTANSCPLQPSCFSRTARWQVEACSMDRMQTLSGQCPVRATAPDLGSGIDGGGAWWPPLAMH